MAVGQFMGAHDRMLESSSIFSPIHASSFCVHSGHRRACRFECHGCVLVLNWLVISIIFSSTRQLRSMHALAIYLFSWFTPSLRIVHCSAFTCLLMTVTLMLYYLWHLLSHHDIFFTWNHSKSATFMLGFSWATYKFYVRHLQLFLGNKATFIARHRSLGRQFLGPSTYSFTHRIYQLYPTWFSVANRSCLVTHTN